MVGFSNRRWLVASLSASLALATGCSFVDDQGVLPEVRVPDAPELSERATVVAGIAIQADTGEPVETATITIGGPSVDRVRNGAGAPQTVFEGSGGFVSFEVEGDGEIDLNVSARAPGHLATSRRVLLDSGERQSFEVRLVRREVDATGRVTSVPRGASGLVAEADISQEDLEVEAPQATRRDGSAGGGSAALWVPQGTAALDEDGNQVAIGAAEATVVYFNTDNDDALESFPGGFAVRVDRDPDEASLASGGADGMFISGAFAAFEMADDQGNPISEFASPITASLEVPAGTVNPQTGEEAQEGDDFPIWSFDPDGGEWTFEQNGVVEGTNEENDNLIVSFETDHLSYWNIGWFSSDTCTARIRVEGADERRLRLSASRRDGGAGFLSSGWYTGTDEFPLRRAPADLPLVIRATLDGEVVGSVTTDNVCDHATSATALALPVDLPEEESGSVTVNVVEECPDGAHRRGIPSSSVWYREGSGLYQPARDTDTSGVSTIVSARAGDVTVRAENRRTGGVFPAQTVAVGADEVAEVTFSHNMDCRIVTGGAGE